MTDDTTQHPGSGVDRTACNESGKAPVRLQAHTEDIVQIMTEGIVFTDTRGMITFVNPALAGCLGYAPAEMVGRFWSEFVLPEHRTMAVAAENRRAKGKAERYELLLQKKDGSGLWTLVGASARKDAATGAYIGSIGVIADIGALKQAETLLRDSEAKYRIILESMQEGYHEVDLRGTFTFVNRSTCKLMGYPPEELIGMNYRQYAADGTNRKKVFQAYNRVFTTGAPLNDLSWDILRKDGERRTVEVSVSLIANKDGKKAGFRGLVRDITERLQAEKEHEKLQAQLIQAQKMEWVGRLAGGVAHDFNNMLGVIQGHAELALSQVDPGHRLYGHLEEIRKAARRSADLTRQLLGFARKQTVAPKVLNLNRTVAGMIKMLRRLIGEDIDLAWVPRDGLWTVRIDPSQIDQICTNLCVNARDAISGTGHLTIETDNAVFDAAYCADHPGFVQGEYVLLAVSDDGCGMEKQTMAHLFEPFFTTKEVDRGTGLGLATVYGIVKQNLGFINVYSEPGQGTSVKIYLPRHLGKTDPLQDQAPTRSTRQGNETVLLVEDEPTILELGKMMLEKFGYRVLSAGSPGEAISLVEGHPEKIDLLVTDVVMPEMNGQELARRLLSADPHLKCLFMSGYTANVIAHHGVLHQGVHFIQKPFSIQALAAKVREALDSPEPRQASS